MDGRPNQLRDNDEVFRRILDVAADAIVTVDEAQKIVHFNHGAEQMFGYSAKEVRGKPLELLLPQRFRAAHGTYVTRFGESAETARLMGHRREVFGLRSDGREFPAEASILKLDTVDGGRLYTAVVRDVTDRKRMDEQQRFLAAVSASLSGSLDYESTLRTVVQLAIPVLAEVAVLDVLAEDGTTLRRVVSSARPEASSVDVTRALDTLRERFAPTWNSPSAVVDVLETRRSAIVSDVTEDWLDAHCENADEIALLHRIGARSMLIVPLIARDAVMGALTLMSTERGRYQETDIGLATNIASRAALALDNSRLYGAARRATRARDDVLGVVSHDLRNPLSAIAMCSKVLADSPPSDPAVVHELATTIRMSADWMARLIQDLLDVSTIEAGQLSVTLQSESVGDVLAHVEHMFAPLAAGQGVTLHVSSDHDVPRVHADAERLVQAISNLVGNAIKFTSEGGTVSVRASVAGDAVVIRVEDTGIGIPEHDLPHIFERFWHADGSSNERGSGLGLAITKGIVDAHGGRVGATSRPRVGSIFTIELPREPRGT